jgi:hypothetical protein
LHLVSLSFYSCSPMYLLLALTDNTAG